MTAVIVIALMTICICNVAILGFLTLIIFDNKIAHGLVSTKLGENPVSRSPEVDAEELRQAKKQYEESQKAFEDMMNYNIYRAYDMDEPQR